MSTTRRLYPGLGSALEEDCSGKNSFPVGMDVHCEEAVSSLLPVREVAMMVIMDRLTDKPEWNKKVFDEHILAKWRKEALDFPDDALWKQASGGKSFDPSEAQGEYLEELSAVSQIRPLKNIITDEIFDYCVKELQNKARYFAESGIVPTLEAEASVAKSDTLVDPELRSTLRRAFDELKADQAEFPDWHPGTDEKVQNLVHPSMYPLVYGSSRVFQSEVVGVNDAVYGWAGRGYIIKHPDHHPDVRVYFGELWSRNYQWLPANVAVDDAGSVKFTSYVNNLHPNEHRSIYSTLEKLVEKAIPMWNQCLAFPDDTNPRIRAGRVSSRFKLDHDANDDNEDNWTPIESEVAGIAVHSDEVDSLREPVQPQPLPFENIDYKPSLRLQEKFNSSGLQIIVKMASIELTPEKPTFPSGSWHLEGLMNERICATALYYLDSENITTSSLAFRMRTDSDTGMEDDEFRVPQDSYKWLERVYGTRLSPNAAPCIQNYGSVETPEGRLLAFPNIFQHCVSPFRLVDPTKPGHRRFIALWLVDPHLRIISTANVPPQQQDWWVDALLGPSPVSEEEALSKLPTGLVRLLQEKGIIGSSGIGLSASSLPPEPSSIAQPKLYVPGMSVEEAREHQEKLMEERTVSQESTDLDWHDERRPSNLTFGAIGTLLILAILLIQTRRALPRVPTYFGSKTESKDRHLINDIQNGTLGFEKIFIVGLPSRTDRRDSMVLAAALSGLEIEFIDGVVGSAVPDKAIPTRPGQGRLPDPSVGSWRGHMNAIQEVVRRNLSSALILEDDADWDVRIRDQLRSFALATQALTQPLHRSEAAFADPTFPRPPAGSESMTPELAFGRLPKTVAPRISPFGDNWDAFWLGHCGMHFPFEDNTVIPRGRVVQADDTVPQQQHLWTLSNPNDVKEQYSNHTRVVHHVQDGICSLGYAVSQKGARQMLHQVGLKNFNAAFDILLRWFCEGVEDRKYHNCLTLQPALFQHHRFAGPKSANSDISDHGEGFQEASTDVVRWSVRMNAEAMMAGEPFVDQFPDAL
ncbi:hypothetical protein JX265_000816 [Neoarthrinium moseri]|uniref:Glycosyltransferase family 25 protein n=1 Tax=Neoarthrinium moseri TaxID=1658444 RepID=A0A9P9WWN5_9PEZI|nr:hypothetical protein JX265_000816 [Neoarthrinium moseri]